VARETREPHAFGRSRLNWRDEPVYSKPMTASKTALDAGWLRAQRRSGSHDAAGSASSVVQRPAVRGKFIFVGERKYWIKGVTYGTFRPDAEGRPYPEPGQIERDFAQMAREGINTVRVYTPPPRALLDIALRHGLRVMVGLAWEQHIAFLDDAGRAKAIVAKLAADVRESAGHAALFCYAVGNEIPASIVRWHGRRRIERFIRRLYSTVKAEDPEALVTYVNFPTTEYLQLPFLDFQCFNVYLESRERLDAYLARLQNLAGEKPLLMAEIGLDSRRNGLAVQAESIAWQIRTAFAAGCVGAFAFAWTDEWHRGGHDIEDWDFGLTTRAREPKPALAAVQRAFADAPFPADTVWPRVSVVVCSCNGARTIRDTLEALKRLEYPNFETIVINDGSNDATPAIAAGYRVKLISTPNRGLSAARNLGWQEATGEIVAYIDDDAYPDPHWLHYLAYRFMTGDWVGVGGPNIAPTGDGPVADCVANAPGGPVHVLVTDTEAEHIPGCNMAFRREGLAAIGGFDPRYRAAGDDVDLCWRLQQHGGRIGFHAAAMDWHHRRNSFAMYWRQQKGYGKAEALLEEKWPERYNVFGHLEWSGRLYGRGFTLPIPAGRSRVYGGVWGSAAYQSLYQPAPLTLLMLPLMPEWYLVILVLAAMSLVGLSWHPLLAALPFLGLAVAAPVAQAALAATRAHFPEAPRSTGAKIERWILVFVMHVIQPLARLIGRLKHGLTPWRRRQRTPLAMPARNRSEIWSETWRPAEAWVAELEAAIRSEGGVVIHGGDFAHWDLRVGGGACGGLLCSIAVEEHGAGKQLVRIRTRAKLPSLVLGAIAGFGIFAALAIAENAWLGGVVLAACAIGLLAVAVRDCAAAGYYWTAAVDRMRPRDTA
jgi:GT2 family glycosyltransferase